ncbi:MAG: PilZ domain-containing protein, partial [Deltaproteobacteria bacterium]|nr:PilZ domain-containing protein [Deltaproteobacteria bacterium]
CKIKYGTTLRLDKIAISADISETGLCIKTNDIYEPGTKLFIKIQAGDLKFEAEGEVMWSRQVPKGLDRVVKNGIGVRFITIDPAFLDFYKEKHDKFEGNAFKLKDWKDKDTGGGTF